MRYRLRLPVRSDAKNTQAESGENEGALADFSPRVSCKRPDPSAPARKTCVSISLLSPSITACVWVHTAMRPSGEGDGAVTVFTFMESSGVHCAFSAAGRTSNRALVQAFENTVTPNRCQQPRPS